MNLYILFYNNKNLLSEFIYIFLFSSFLFSILIILAKNMKISEKNNIQKIHSGKSVRLGGIVFVYQGSEQYFEKAQEYILDEVLEHPASYWIVYETPFYNAVNSSLDYPHHAFHSMFYYTYGIYRAFSGKKTLYLLPTVPKCLKKAIIFLSTKYPRITSKSPFILSAPNTMIL